VFELMFGWINATQHAQRSALAPLTNRISLRLSQQIGHALKQTGLLHVMRPARVVHEWVILSPHS
jgi:hypothetical protein